MTAPDPRASHADADADSPGDRMPYDVAMVGLGPVSQVLGLLLARRGHRIVSFERQRRPYPLPRAVHIDPDVLRVLDEIGVTDELDDVIEVARIYEWQNADRRTLLRFPFRPHGEQGWADSYMFHQPGLEHVLKRAGERMGEERIAVRRGSEVVGLRQRDDGVELDVRDLDAGDTATYRARYVVGCDGAKSFVRDALGIGVTDLGLCSRWVVVDVLGELESPDEPDNLQVCDPVRPWTSVAGGPGHRRFEFMARDGEALDDLATSASVQRLFADIGVEIAPEAIERIAPYTFEANFADRWRSGRVLLAGDAAHRMPPFYGQGLVSGVRDAAGLAWKLDLVLRGDADEALLDTYESERKAHVQHAIGMSVELGRIICETDPAAVAARDAHLLAVGPNPADALQPPPPERLGPGVFPGGEPDAVSDEGTFAPQGRLRNAAGDERLLDRIADGAFALVCDGEAISGTWLLERHHETPPGLQMCAVRVLERGAEIAGEVANEDLDDRLLPWLRSTGRVAAIVRPDFVVYGGAATLDETQALVASLAERLHLAGAPVS